MAGKKDKGYVCITCSRLYVTERRLRDHMITCLGTMCMQSPTDISEMVANGACVEINQPPSALHPSIMHQLDALYWSVMLMTRFSSHSDPGVSFISQQSTPTACTCSRDSSEIQLHSTGSSQLCPELSNGSEPRSIMLLTSRTWVLD